MSIEEYYSAKDALKIPDVEFMEQRKWLLEKKQELLEQLSDDDKKIILARQLAWKNKTQSSVG